MDILLSILRFDEARPARGFDLTRFLSWIVMLAATLASITGLSQENSPSEFQVEAAFLYHFANFVSWPPQVFPTDDTPISIGVVAEDSFSNEIESTIRHKTVNGRALKVVRLQVTDLQQARQCQILFIGSSERKRLSEILDALKGQSVLTVGKMDHFIQSGGMINFVLDEKKVRFEINDEAAKQAGLKISAKLLNLSRNKGTA